MPPSLGRFMRGVTDDRSIERTTGFEPATLTLAKERRGADREPYLALTCPFRYDWARFSTGPLHVVLPISSQRLSPVGHRSASNSTVHSGCTEGALAPAPLPFGTFGHPGPPCRAHITRRTNACFDAGYRVPDLILRRARLLAHPSKNADEASAVSSARARCRAGAGRKAGQNLRAC